MVLVGTPWEPLVFLCILGIWKRKIGHKKVNFEWNINFHEKPMLPFYTPWKYQETRSFLVISGGYRIKALARNGFSL